MEAFLSRYRIVQQVDKGSFSTIYLVRQKASGRLFAAKHLPKGTVSLELPEVIVFRLLQKSPHPNIIHTKEILEDEKDIFLIQEFAERGNLVQYRQWKEKQLSLGVSHKDTKHNSRREHEEEARRMVWQLLCAVAHLHSLGIAHRDIKLENALITATGDLKLADFNLSCFFSPSSCSPRSSVESLHRQCCGTPLYSAPELYFGVPYRGPELDVWSIGVFTYRLLYGVFPFKSDRADKEQRRFSLQRRIMTANYTLPSSEEVSEEAKELLRCVFIINPKDRPAVQQLLLLPWLSSFPSPCPPPFSLIAGPAASSPSPFLDEAEADSNCNTMSKPLPSPTIVEWSEEIKPAKVNKDKDKDKDKDKEFPSENSEKLKHKMKTAIKLLSNFVS